jgi:outer membrane lipopolysaccharide assembly protein LptE/RlpB
MYSLFFNYKNGLKAIKNLKYIIRIFNLFILSISMTLIIGCGFKLRGQIDNTYLEIKNWKIVGSISPELEKNIKKQINIRKGSIDNTSSAQAVLDISENYQESINTINSKGQISEIRLKYTVTFLARQANKDKVILIPNTIHQFRDIAVTDSSALAKEQEKQKLLKDMQYNVSTRILEVIQKISATNID